jgi:16S rRNA (guanine1516-N2)-methyltransferase
MRDALGKNKNMRILDCTAGFCRDALRLAYWGHTVTSCERDPTLQTLLLAAFDEARKHDFYAPWIERLHFVANSTEDFLNNNKNSVYDIVLIDAMFPDEKRKGLPRKDLQDIKAILADDTDNAEELLKFCLEFPWKEKPKKILVKRPLKAPVLSIKKASHEYRGRSHRWDLYLP